MPTTFLFWHSLTIPHSFVFDVTICSIVDVPRPFPTDYSGDAHSVRYINWWCISDHLHSFCSCISVVHVTLFLWLFNPQFIHSLEYSFIPIPSFYYISIHCSTFSLMLLFVTFYSTICYYIIRLHSIHFLFISFYIRVVDTCWHFIHSGIHSIPFTTVWYFPTFIWSIVRWWYRADTHSIHSIPFWRIVYICSLTIPTDDIPVPFLMGILTYIPTVILCLRYDTDTISFGIPFTHFDDTIDTIDSMIPTVHSFDGPVFLCCVHSFDLPFVYIDDTSDVHIVLIVLHSMFDTLFYHSGVVDVPLIHSDHHSFHSFRRFPTPIAMFWWWWWSTFVHSTISFVVIRSIHCCSIRWYVAFITFCYRWYNSVDEPDAFYHSFVHSVLLRFHSHHSLMFDRFLPLKFIPFVHSIPFYSFIRWWCDTILLTTLLKFIHSLFSLPFHSCSILHLFWYHSFYVWKCCIRCILRWCNYEGVTIPPHCLFDTFPTCLPFLHSYRCCYILLPRPHNCCVVLPIRYIFWFVHLPCSVLHHCWPTCSHSRYIPLFCSFLHYRCSIHSVRCVLRWSSTYHLLHFVHYIHYIDFSTLRWYCSTVTVPFRAILFYRGVRLFVFSPFLHSYSFIITFIHSIPLIIPFIHLIPDDVVHSIHSFHYLLLIPFDSFILIDSIHFIPDYSIHLLLLMTSYIILFIRVDDWYSVFWLFIFDDSSVVDSIWLFVLFICFILFVILFMLFWSWCWHSYHILLTDTFSHSHFWYLFYRYIPDDDIPIQLLFCDIRYLPDHCWYLFLFITFLGDVIPFIYSLPFPFCSLMFIHSIHFDDTVLTITLLIDTMGHVPVPTYILNPTTTICSDHSFYIHSTFCWPTILPTYHHYHCYDLLLLSLRYGIPDDWCLPAYCWFYIPRRRYLHSSRSLCWWWFDDDRHLTFWWCTPIPFCSYISVRYLIHSFWYVRHGIPIHSVPCSFHSRYLVDAILFYNSYILFDHSLHSHSIIYRFPYLVFRFIRFSPYRYLRYHSFDWRLHSPTVHYHRPFRYLIHLTFLRAMLPFIHSVRWVPLFWCIPTIRYRYRYDYLHSYTVLTFSRSPSTAMHLITVLFCCCSASFLRFYILHSTAIVDDHSILHSYHDACSVLPFYSCSHSVLCSIVLFHVVPLPFYYIPTDLLFFYDPLHSRLIPYLPFCSFISFLPPFDAVSPFVRSFYITTTVTFYHYRYVTDFFTIPIVVHVDVLFNHSDYIPMRCSFVPLPRKKIPLLFLPVFPISCSYSTYFTPPSTNFPFVVDHHTLPHHWPFGDTLTILIHSTILHFCLFYHSYRLCILEITVTTMFRYYIVRWPFWHSTDTFILLLFPFWCHFILFSSVLHSVRRYICCSDGWWVMPICSWLPPFVILFYRFYDVDAVRFCSCNYILHDSYDCWPFVTLFHYRFIRCSDHSTIRDSTLHSTVTFCLTTYRPHSLPTFTYRCSFAILPHCLLPTCCSTVTVMVTILHLPLHSCSFRPTDHVFVVLPHSTVVCLFYRSGGDYHSFCSTIRRYLPTWWPGYSILLFCSFYHSVGDTLHHSTITVPVMFPIDTYYHFLLLYISRALFYHSVLSTIPILPFYHFCSHLMQYLPVHSTIHSTFDHHTFYRYRYHSCSILPTITFWAFSVPGGTDTTILPFISLFYHIPPPTILMGDTDTPFYITVTVPTVCSLHSFYFLLIRLHFYSIHSVRYICSTVISFWYRCSIYSFDTFYKLFCLDTIRLIPPLRFPLHCWYYTFWFFCHSIYHHSFDYIHSGLHSIHSSFHSDF